MRLDDPMANGWCDQGQYHCDCHLDVRSRALLKWCFAYGSHPGRTEAHLPPAILSSQSEMSTPTIHCPYQRETPSLNLQCRTHRDLPPGRSPLLDPQHL